MITAIRYATYNDSLETEIKCPKCGHDNLFKLNLQYAIDNMEFLESEYVINLESGLSVFLRPYAFPELLKSLLSQFEQTKLARAIESQTITDADRSAIVKKAFKELAVAKFDMLSAAVARVVDEANGIDVSNREHIKDFLQNIDTKSADAISSLVTKINAVGIKRTFDATCEKCEHTWESEIDFNPVNFS
jgi:DNA-directed RNA polymerase subunit M/transcription elongation factor TFIIS